MTATYRHSLAALSPDKVYRYGLLRRWDSGTLLRWIMLNPSTADAQLDDPTIRRCVGFARAWGYPGIVVHNLYALRATNPADLLDHPDPVGDENDQHLAAWSAADTVCAWGTNGDRARPGRPAQVLELLREQAVTPLCLGTTTAGHPRHPLYVAASTPLIELKVPAVSQ